MRRMWREFVEKYPEIKSTRLHHANNGPPISFSCFRNIFIKHLSEECSFRVAKIDTCQTCDTLTTKQQKIERDILLQANEETVKERELELLAVRTELEKHLKIGEGRYGALDYDIRVLATS